MEKIISVLKKIIPKNVFKTLQPIYHYKLALLGALLYGFPSRKIKVVAVTGTKGKSSVTEMVNAILEESRFKTALLNTIRFKVHNQNEKNLYKMSTPGRFFVQKFLRNAVSANCDYAILEMTSEAARQFRHKFIQFDALIFTNLSPEHIESHGSYEKYVEAKLSIGKALEKSLKQNRVIVVNADEKEAEKFLALNIPKKMTYSLSDVGPYNLENGKISFTFEGEKINPTLEGLFNIYNCLASATFAKSQGVSVQKIKEGLEKMSIIRGRVEHIKNDMGIKIIVDYAHTADSLEKLYKTFPNQKKICVLGNTGGGRDAWKRPEMGKVADTYCDKIILTNEDPYGEDPRAILADMEKGFSKHKPEIILDRREAIAEALRSAKRETLNPTNVGSGARNQDVVVLITGKGTDPFIMGPNGTKLPWDDADVVREELKKIKV